MTTIEIPRVNPQTKNENASNGVSADDLNSTTMESSLDQNITQDFNEDLDEHVSPAPTIKAIKRVDPDGQGLSDDESVKTLITLETVKKPVQLETEDLICPIEAPDEDFDEETVLLEVVNEDGEDESKPLKDTSTNETGKMVTGNTLNNVSNRKERKQNFPIITSNGLVSTPKPNANFIKEEDTFVTPNKPIPAASAGTTEIPHELILSDLNVSTPIIINHVNISATKSDDLIAILEGDDDASIKVESAVEHYELSLPNTKTNGNQNVVLSREKEREIAMEQMMNLPKKKKGRPKLKSSAKDTQTSKQPKKLHNDELVALVNDWSDNETKVDDTNESETEIFVEINIPQKKRRKASEHIQPVEPTFRRSRIIKKKIIWDPDAPETAINYASLAHTSGAGLIKKPRKSITKKEHDSEQMAEMLPTPPSKKKKSSEIDKLLGDEGAANMLNSLNQGNNNNNTDGTVAIKIQRTRPIKNEGCNVSNATIVSFKAKNMKIKETKEPLNSQPKSQIATDALAKNVAKNVAANKKNASPKSSSGGKKRGPKPANESWDYIYKSRPDDCMIIRRRSNSSYSSTASLNHQSIDLPNSSLSDNDADQNEHSAGNSSKRSRITVKDKHFEFAKPTATKGKKVGRNDDDSKYQNAFDTVQNHKSLENVKLEDFEIDHVPIKVETNNDKFASFEQISIDRYENFMQIILQPNVFGTKTFLNIQMFQEIEIALRSAENDKSCKLVLITSATESFCNGLDYSTLVQPAIEKRRLAAIDLSKKLK